MTINFSTPAPSLARVLTMRHASNCPHCSGNVRCRMGTRMYVAALVEAEQAGIPMVQSVSVRVQCKCSTVDCPTE